ncbi:MAG: EamA family transporter, partial [Gammaproteobacteria bacterium]
GALTLGLVAVVLVLSRGQFERLTLSPEPALLWVLAGAFCFALFSVLSKQVHYEPVLLNMLFFAVALLASAGAMLGFSSFRVPEGDAWWSVLANGVLVNGISYLFWLNALRLRPASELAVLVFLTPVLSTVYLYLLYRDEFLPVYWVAIGCIVVAGMMTVHSHASVRT